MSYFYCANVVLLVLPSDAQTVVLRDLYLISCRFLYSDKRVFQRPWQVMLKQTDNSYACVAESETRFTLNETKEELLRVLGLKEEQGSQLEFLRRGYKTATWWEEDVDLELSSTWRN
ncbi:hypothetical protein HanXRQr2_Chr04g0145511 [Helianthus annuus]|uniref:DUF1995 domain-containing protein n=1 Tax=Helianthus annuus TaxID=4232 RepID=A0A9K3J475_HELAN|nr:hypothetical protein HanXRQr2_Chr04g0145511 [Helianthus annuus]KAJ0579623.1 putative protein LOW PSII ACCUMULATION 3 [Helianthus annuus]KAJ0595519.1 putative protein LOW PSII ACCUMULATION 3 [Helianthus annuus]